MLSPRFQTSEYTSPAEGLATLLIMVTLFPIQGVVAADQWLRSVGYGAKAVQEWVVAVAIDCLIPMFLYVSCHCCSMWYYECLCLYLSPVGSVQTPQTFGNRKASFLVCPRQTWMRHWQKGLCLL